MSSTFLSRTDLSDAYASEWFKKISEAREKFVERLIAAGKEPANYHDLHKKIIGNLGLTASCHIEKKMDGPLFTYHMSVDKRLYEEWAKAHLYLMEGPMMFRIGPMIVSHPGRKKGSLTWGGKTIPKPIDIWEVRFGLLSETGVDWYNLVRNNIIIGTKRKNGTWIVKKYSS